MRQLAQIVALMPRLQILDLGYFRSPLQGTETIREGLLQLQRHRTLQTLMFEWRWIRHKKRNVLPELDTLICEGWNVCSDVTVKRVDITEALLCFDNGRARVIELRRNIDVRN